MAKPLTPPAPRIDWDPIREDFLVENMFRIQSGGAPYNLKEVAAKWKIAYGTVRNKAQQQGWTQQLLERQAKTKELADDRLQEFEAYNEAEVRFRQARYAKAAMNLAMKKLVTLNPQDISIKEMIELLKLGLIEERKALGLPDAFVVDVNTNKTQELTPERVKEIALTFIQMVKNAGGDPAALEGEYVEVVENPVAEQPS